MTHAAALRPRFDAQRAAFARGAPDYRGRMQALTVLQDAVHARPEARVPAAADDFGGRTREETLRLELCPFYDPVRHARRHLKAWMRHRRVGGSWFLLPSRAFVQYQPLGAVGAAARFRRASQAGRRGRPFRARPPVQVRAVETGERRFHDSN
jgi:coniferyl-aldehyde dehydrogenase